MAKKVTTSFINGLRADLQEMKQSIVKADSKFKTNCLLQAYPTRTGTQLNFQRSTYEILEEAARIVASVKAGRELMGSKKTTFMGYSLKAWEDDIKLRYAQLQRKENLAAIDAIQRELTNYLTPEELREIGIMDVADRVAKLKEEI